MIEMPDFKAVFIGLFVVCSLFFLGIGYAGHYLYSRLTENTTSVYQEVMVSDTTRLDDGRLMILQHKEFKRVK